MNIPEIPAAYIPVIISAAAFLVAIMLFAGIYVIFRQRGRQRETIREIKRKGQDMLTAPVEPIITSSDTADRGGMTGFFAKVGKRVSGGKEVDYSQSRLRFLQAGFRSIHAPTVLLGAKCCCALILSIGFIALRLTVLPALPIPQTIAVLTLCALVGFYMPELWMFLRIRSRRDKVLKGFPDALDLLVVCVEAGVGLDLAMTRVAKELQFNHKALANELRLYTLEMMAGMPRQEALKNLSRRIGLEDVDNMVTLLNQADKFGTSVAKTMRIYSDSLRTKRFMRAEEKAEKLTVKLIFPLILFIFPSLFVVILGPAAIRIYEALLKR